MPMNRPTTVRLGERQKDALSSLVREGSFRHGGHWTIGTRSIAQRIMESLERAGMARKQGRILMPATRRGEARSVTEWVPTDEGRALGESWEAERKRRRAENDRVCAEIARKARPGQLRAQIAYLTKQLAEAEAELAGLDEGDA